MSTPPAVHRADFPADFIWGVATSAFQIEGGAHEDGRGASIWDDFCRQTGRIADGSNGDVACDHFHRWEADLDLIASLGVRDYRFSIAWPRVQPLGCGEWNEAGVAFYARLLQGLQARGIRAHVTLNHWDLPSVLQARGGWAARDTVQHFVAYALGIAQRFGSQISTLCTHNEPWVVAILGHEQGIFAPGVRSRAVAMQVTHHLLLSHGLALRALRQAGFAGKLGIVLNMAPAYPASDSEADRAKARLDDGMGLRWYVDPLLRGVYPADAVQHLGSDAPHVLPGDMAAIAAPLDFLGINYYSRHMASADCSWNAATSGLERTDMGWEIYPQGLSDLLRRLHGDYTLPPVLITENGAAFPDVAHDGRVPDAPRCRYLQQHIGAVAHARAAGVPVQGYFVWSLLDNFEWASGYAKRFGIVHVDYATQTRTPKDSALWYRDFLAARASATSLARS
jgi:beta-glucosidase